MAERSSAGRRAGDSSVAFALVRAGRLRTTAFVAERPPGVGDRGRSSRRQGNRRRRNHRWVESTRPAARPPAAAPTRYQPRGDSRARRLILGGSGSAMRGRHTTASIGGAGPAHGMRTSAEARAPDRQRAPPLSSGKRVTSVWLPGLGLDERTAALQEPIFRHQGHRRPREPTGLEAPQCYCRFPA